MIRMVDVDRNKPVYIISVVAEMLSTTQQQLRIYEKEKLVVPKRTRRNTRLYSQSDVEILQRIIRLHQDLGINLAGIEVILNMRRRMEDMEREFNDFVGMVRDRFGYEITPGSTSECTDLIPMPRSVGLVPMKKKNR